MLHRYKYPKRWNAKTKTKFFFFFFLVLSLLYSIDVLTCDVSIRKLTGSDHCSLPSSMLTLHDLVSTYAFETRANLDRKTMRSLSSACGHLCSLKHGQRPVYVYIYEHNMSSHLHDWPDWRNRSNRKCVWTATSIQLFRGNWFLNKLCATLQWKYASHIDNKRKSDYNFMATAWIRIMAPGSFLSSF